MMMTVRLGDLGTGHVWFTSVGHPAGCDVQPEEGGDGSDLLLPGDAVVTGDGSEWWDLTGTVEGARWEWDGRGSPRDWRGNTVQRIVAFVPAE